MRRAKQNVKSRLVCLNFLVLKKVGPSFEDFVQLAPDWVDSTSSKACGQEGASPWSFQMDVSARPRPACPA